MFYGIWSNRLIPGIYHSFYVIIVPTGDQKSANWLDVETWSWEGQVSHYKGKTILTDKVCGTTYNLNY